MAINSSSADFVPATQSELARFMVENAIGLRQTICPVGGRTALNDCPAMDADLIVSTADLVRVIDYPARDMTITVEAGTRISELQTLLATERQRLPIDIAQASRATLGGAIATNTSGPRRFGHGTFRDYVIGISAVDAQGQLFKAGGRVVKNVAGYDVCKLLVGSRGTLGVITQVTLKLRPSPDTSALLWLGFASLDEIDRAVERLMLSGARPVAIEVLNPLAASLISKAARGPTTADSPVLCLGVEGTQREVDWQVDTLLKELSGLSLQSTERINEPDAARLWDALTEFPVCADDPLTFQANLLPSKSTEFIKRATQAGVTALGHAGNGVVIGQLPDEAATIERTTAILRELRELAVNSQGNLMILHCDPEWKSISSICESAGSDKKLMQRLKRQLDPHGILNPGRLVVARTAN